GAANAPKVGDASAWRSRVAQGMDALVHNAVKGKGAMPPKGGMMNLGEADIRNAVVYMLEESNVVAE
ncbi:MAG: c-type cytochrome, partial [Gammaproteobacteria bacterium]